MRYPIRNITHYMSSRRYATASRRVVQHAHYELHQWPKGKLPSPFEIFDIKLQADYDNRLELEKGIKTTYQKYVKIYHPDLSSLHEVECLNGKVLLPEQKRARFDAIQSAYELLKDSKKRLAYEKYQTTTWGDYREGKTTNFEAYRMANAHRRKYAYEQDPQFWQAATWEDYYRMRYGRAAPTREEFEKNKWKILWRVLAVCSVVVTLQIMLAVERTHEFNRQTRIRNLRAEADLSNAYSNYDDGVSQFQRIRRFLLYRRLGLTEIDHDGAKRHENEMLTKYAQERVKRLD